MHCVTDPGLVSYYAFTYPFTYSELQAQLAAYDAAMPASPAVYATGSGVLG